MAPEGEMTKENMGTPVCAVCGLPGPGVAEGNARRASLATGASIASAGLPAPGAGAAGAGPASPDPGASKAGDGPASPDPGASKAGDGPASPGPAEEGGCPRCGYPLVGAETARVLLEGTKLAADGLLDQSIRSFQKAVRMAPDSFVPRLKLAAAYVRKGLGGEEALLKLAEREYDTALRLAPLDRTVHLARLGLAARRGSLPSLKAEYEARSGELPFAAECLKMIAALETGGVAGSAVDPDDGKRKVRYLFMGAAAALLMGGLSLFFVIYRAIDRGGVDVFSVDFLLCVGLLTAAGAMTMDGLRERKKKE